MNILIAEDDTTTRSIEGEEFMILLSHAECTAAAYAIPVIALTANAMPEDRDRCLAAIYGK